MKGKVEMYQTKSPIASSRWPNANGRKSLVAFLDDR